MQGPGAGGGLSHSAGLLGPPRCDRHSLGRLGGSVWPWGAEPLIPQALESDEKSHYLAVMEAMRVIGFSAEEVGSVHRILAAILHLVSLAGGLRGYHSWRRRLTSDVPDT